MVLGYLLARIKYKKYQAYELARIKVTIFILVAIGLSCLYCAVVILSKRILINPE